MRPKVIAPDTETITFHISSDSKSFLREAAKMQGRPFSELIRDAIDQYIVLLQEDDEINELRKMEEHKGMVSVYDTATKSIGDIERELGRTQEDYQSFNFMWDFLRKSFIQETLNRIDKYAGPPFEKTSPEIRAISFTLLLGIARQLLLFIKRTVIWMGRIEKEAAKLELAKRQAKEIKFPSISEIEFPEQETKEKK